MVRSRLIVIPAYNEQDSIAAVVTGCLRFGPVLVVDDGSTDETRARVVNLGCYLIAHDVNRGYDSALASGVEYALLNRFDSLLFIDADGQHDPNDVPFFFDRLNSGVDVCVGNRDSKARFSEYLFAKIWSFFGVKDPLCGYKAFSRKAITLFDKESYRGYVGTELVYLSLRSGLEVESLNIKVRGRSGVSRFGPAILANIQIMALIAPSTFKLVSRQLISKRQL